MQNWNKPARWWACRTLSVVLVIIGLVLLYYPSAVASLQSTAVNMLYYHIAQGGSYGDAIEVVDMILSTSIPSTGISIMCLVLAICSYLLAEP